MSCHLVSSSLALIALAVVACEPAEPAVRHPRRALDHVDEQAPTSCEPQRPTGSIADLTTPIGSADPAAPRLDPLVTCPSEPGGGYLAVRGHGQRELVMPQQEPPPCATLPESADPTAATVCPTVDSGVFGAEVMAQLHAAGIETIGFGLGACGDISGDYTAWHLAISINDWRKADAAIRIIDAELRRWDVGNQFGLSVNGIDCGVPL